MKETTSALEKFPEYEVNIGIEVHVQLTTKSKIFCTAPMKYQINLIAIFAKFALDNQAFCPS